MNEPIHAALYARVSSQRQADEKTIRSQLQDIDERAQRDGVNIAANLRFCDDGYSGSELMRPTLEALRDHLACGVIDRLYVHSPDRLARNLAHQAILLQEAKVHNCEVVFLNQEGLPDSPETNLLIHMQGMIAEYEREKILERTRRGRRQAASEGRVSVFSGAPYGYRYISKREGNGIARWEIDPDESQHVQLMFTLVGEQGRTLGDVCRELETWGIPTRNGNAHWDRSTIRGILLNSAYYGEAKYGKRRMAPRKQGKRAKRGDPRVPRQAKIAVATKPEEQTTIAVPAIVSRSLFQQVGRRMEENRKRNRRHKDGTKYLLSGLLVCGECGSAYCSWHHANKYLYYRCIGTDRDRFRGKPICDNRSAKGVQLENCIWSEVCQLLQDPAQIADEIERRQKADRSTSTQLSELEERVQGLRSRMDRIIDAYANGFLAKSEFESRIVPLREHYDRENTALTNLRGECREADVHAAEANLATIAKEVAGRLEEASYDLKRELLELLVKRIEIHAHEIRIVYKVPFHPFLRGPASTIASGDFLQHCLRRRVMPLACPAGALEKTSARSCPEVWGEELVAGAIVHVKPNCHNTKFS